MNRPITAIALAGLLLLAGCSAAPIDTTAATADGPSASNSTTIVTTGTGSVSAEPDTAVLQLAIVSTGKSAEAVRADAADRTAALLDALAEAGVPEEAITTAGYSLTATYDYAAGEREPTGYRAVHSLRVETAPDSAGTVLDTAVGSAGVEVYGVQFTLSDAAHEELRADAISNAVTSARADADAAAGAAGLTVTGVEHLNVGSSPNYNVRFAEMDAAGTQFQPGTVSVTVTVTVTYRAA
jgi:hypothetical protein